MLTNTAQPARSPPLGEASRRARKRPEAGGGNQIIARKLAGILCGGPGGAAKQVTEQDMFDLEREVFLSLCGEQKTLDRMQHMLMNNKPLRN